LRDRRALDRWYRPVGMSAQQQRAVHALVRLVVPAGAAKPSPPVGPALGQHGVNIMSFCKDFNAKTSEHKPETPVPVTIKVFGDKTFEWEMKTPPTSYFVAKCAGLAPGGGSAKPGHASVGSISLKHVYEIAKVKAGDPGMTRRDAEFVPERRRHCAEHGGRGETRFVNGCVCVRVCVCACVCACLGG